MFRTVLLGAAALFLAQAGFADTFVAVNSSPFPINELTTFDPANPAAADPASPTAILSGPFIRGIAMTDASNGWYIQTSTTTGAGDPGFYQLIDGTPSLVAAQPFGNSSDTGGLTFSQDRSFLYAVIDPPGTGSNSDTLYRVDFDGTYTEIGEVNILDGSGTSIRISGIAVNPLDGKLYGLDGLRDQLYLISTTDGTGSVVGDLGVNLDNLTSGLDFTLDGSRLIAANNEFGVSSVYEVDVTTGAITSTLGVLPFSTSSISAIPEPASLCLIALGVGLLRRR